MSVKRLDNGDYIITIKTPHTISGVGTRTLQKPWADEFTKFLDEQSREEQRTEWPPAQIEAWEKEGGNAFISEAPDRRVAVILETTAGLWAGKWRDKERNIWVTRMGVAYTPEEIIEMFRKQTKRNS